MLVLELQKNFSPGTGTRWTMHNIRFLDSMFSPSMVITTGKTSWNKLAQWIQRRTSIHIGQHWLLAYAWADNHVWWTNHLWKNLMISTASYTSSAPLPARISICTVLPFPEARKPTVGSEESVTDSISIKFKSKAPLRLRLKKNTSIIHPSIEMAQ